MPSAEQLQSQVAHGLDAFANIAVVMGLADNLVSVYCRYYAVRNNMITID